MLKHIIKAHVENRNLFLNKIIFTNAFTNQETFSNANYDQPYLKKKKKIFSDLCVKFFTFDAPKNGSACSEHETKRLDDISSQCQPLLQLNPLKTLGHCLEGLKHSPLHLYSRLC